MSADIKGMIDSYAEYLRLNYPVNFDRFALLLTSNPEGALAEAIVFGFLQSLHLSPEIHDQVGKGGPDFICAGSTLSFAMRRLVPPGPEDRFVVEATSLDLDAVTNRSGLPNEEPRDMQGSPFSLITRSICNKVKDKTPQLGGHRMPRVLAVACNHPLVGTILNADAARFVLTSNPKIIVEIGSEGPGSECTDLRDSAFLKINRDGRAVVPRRQTVSAVLLIAVYGNHSEVYGILHPELAHRLNTGFFPKVPFVRLAMWPVVDGLISTEWVISDPEGLRVDHWPVRTKP